MLFVVATFALMMASFIVYKQIEIGNRQQAIEKQIVAQKELADNIMRSMSQYATKGDIEKFAKDQNVNLEAIKKDLDSLNASVTAINEVVVVSRGQSKTGVGSTSTNPNPNPRPIDPANPDPFGYQKDRQELALSEQFENVNVPFGKVGFSAWEKSPWDYTVYPRQYNLTNVIGTDENQRHYVYNKFAVKVGEKNYDIKINQAQTLEEYPEAKFSWWNPKLHLTIGGGLGVSSLPIKGDAAIGVTIGIMSYGKYKTNPDLSILEVGAGFQFGSERPAVIINPINYNIGKLLPGNIANNTYMGPQMQITTEGSVLLGAGIGLGF